MVNILLKNPTLWGTFLNQLENRTQIPWEKSPGVPPGHEITSDLFYVGGFYPGVFQLSLPYAAFTNSSDMGLHLDVEVDPSWVEHLESLSTLGREELDVRANKNSDGRILHYLRYVDMPADDRIAFVSGFAFGHDSIEWVEHVDDLVGEIEYQTNLMKRYATAFLKEIEQAVGPSDLAKEVVDEIESEYSTPSGPTLMTPDNARKLQEEIAKSRGNKGRCMYCGAEWLIDEEEPYHNGDCTGRPSWASTLWARRFIRARKMKKIQENSVSNFNERRLQRTARLEKISNDDFARFIEGEFNKPLMETAKKLAPKMNWTGGIHQLSVKQIDSILKGKGIIHESSGTDIEIHVSMIHTIKTPGFFGKLMGGGQKIEGTRKSKIWASWKPVSPDAYDKIKSIMNEYFPQASSTMWDPDSKSIWLSQEYETPFSGSAKLEADILAHDIKGIQQIDYFARNITGRKH